MSPHKQHPDGSAASGVPTEIEYGQADLSKVDTLRRYVDALHFENKC